MHRKLLLILDMLFYLAWAAIVMTAARLTWNLVADTSLSQQVFDLAFGGVVVTVGSLLLGHLPAIRQSLTEDQDLYHKAYHDPLTGLANRALLLNRLELSLQQAYRNQSMLAVLFLDLDGFKQVNDAHGHKTGDKILIRVAARLSHIRGTDTVARLGGDEFVVILSDVHSSTHVENKAKQIIHGIAAIRSIDSMPVDISASIGIALFPEDAMESAQLLLKADQAMYRAKTNGGNGFHFYWQDIENRQVS